jgi:hypothetical protein
MGTEDVTASGVPERALKNELAMESAVIGLNYCWRRWLHGSVTAGCDAKLLPGAASHLFPFPSLSPSQKVWIAPVKC